MDNIGRSVALAGALLTLWVIPSLVTAPDNPLVMALWGGGMFLRRHFFTALLPAFLLAGATTTFVNRRAVVTYLGSDTFGPLAFGISAVASSIMAFCSCMVLPVFAGIYRRGAGLGPAVTFLYCGPAVNVMALLLTGSVLGVRLAFGRAAAALILGIVVGLLMQAMFGSASTSSEEAAGGGQPGGASMGRGVVVLVLLVAAAFSVNWARTGDLRAVAICCPGGDHYYQVEGRLVERNSENVVLRDQEGRRQQLPRPRVVALQRTWKVPGSGPYGLLPWAVFCTTLLGLLASITGWYDTAKLREWGAETIGFVNRLFPLLLAGIVGSVLLFGYRGQEGLIARDWISAAVGGNSPGALLTASVSGAGMYFATLTEIPIVQALLAAGMGRGTALTMLLSGPVVSIPALLVVRKVLGNIRTAGYIGLVILTAIGAGACYAVIF